MKARSGRAGSRWSTTASSSTAALASRKARRPVTWRSQASTSGTRRAVRSRRRAAVVSGRLRQRRLDDSKRLTARQREGLARACASGRAAGRLASPRSPRSTASTSCARRCWPCAVPWRRCAQPRSGAGRRAQHSGLEVEQRAIVKGERSRSPSPRPRSWRSHARCADGRAGHGTPATGSPATWLRLPTPPRRAAPPGSLSIHAARSTARAVALR